MYRPGVQLQKDLKGAVSNALQLRRPLLTHLNADTSWVLSLPYPDSEPCPLGRSLFNILIDPWLQGPQSDVASWFSQQWHAVDSSVQTLAELDACLRDAENLVQSPHPSSPEREIGFSGTKHQGNISSYIDLLVVSHEFTDHCNFETLQQLPPSTPVLATKKAAHLILSWKHFRRVYPIGCFPQLNYNWKNTSSEALPPWLGIARITTNRDALYFHSAILITFNIGPSTQNGPTEGIVYTPHGINADDLKMLRLASPPISVLALLHGLHDIRISIRQLNLGAHNALRAQRTSGSKYWVSTRE